MWLRLVWLVLLLAGAGAAFGQTASPPQRPFSQLIELWTRQLDRVATRAEQANLLPVEIDALREQVADVRAAASAAAAIARNDLADTKKLLAPLEAKPGGDGGGGDRRGEGRSRPADRAGDGQREPLKQCEVIIARADQLTERLTKLRGQVMLRTPCCTGTSRRCRPTSGASSGPNSGRRCRRCRRRWRRGAARA